MVACRSPELRLKAELKARAEIDLGRDLVSTAVSRPRGKERITETHYRLRDYFDDIRIERQPDSSDAFRLVFDARANADRYWRDLMVQIVGELRDEGASVEVLVAIPDRKN